MSGGCEVETEVKKCCAIKRPHLSAAAGNTHQRINKLISQDGAQVKVRTVASVPLAWCSAMGKLQF